jgi:hypothetical protein
LLARDKARRKPVDCPSDDRHQDGMSPAQALVRNVGTCGLDAKVETSKWWTHEEPSTKARGRGGRVRGSDEVR